MLDKNNEILIKEKLISALKNFINPTGHTDVCMELREFGHKECNKNCREAREALEEATGEKIISKI